MLDKIIKVLNSNGFQTFVILIVGLFAYINYKVNIRDNRRNAASIIINEIRAIEIEIKNLRDASDYYNSRPIIKSNEWSKNKHLFTKFLDQDEFNCIDEFYRIASRIEEERVILREQLSYGMNEKCKALQWKVVEVADRLINENVEENKDINKLKDVFMHSCEEIADIVYLPTPNFMGNLPKNLIKILIEQCAFITTTTAAEKLKQITTSSRIDLFRF